MSVPCNLHMGDGSFHKSGAVRLRIMGSLIEGSPQIFQNSHVHVSQGMKYGLVSLAMSSQGTGIKVYMAVAAKQYTMEHIIRAV